MKEYLTNAAIAASIGTGFLAMIGGIGFVVLSLKLWYKAGEIEIYAKAIETIGATPETIQRFIEAATKAIQ